MCNVLRTKQPCLTVNGHPTLIIGQPDSCDTVPMLIAIIARKDATSIIKYYGDDLSDAIAFRTILSTLTFTNEEIGKSDLEKILSVEILQLTKSVACSTINPNSGQVVKPRARMCLGAPMYIPTEGTLSTPWNCFGTGCGPYKSGAQGYFAQGHRGLDIVGGQGAGVTPIYAPYNEIVKYYWNNTDNQKFYYSLRLFYDAPYNSIASYLTHMGTDDTSSLGKSLITVSDGARVTGGITKLGYQGYSGLTPRSDENTHLHISWHKSNTGEWYLADTYNPTQFLWAENLAYSSNWQRKSGPLTCTTTPGKPPTPPSTDFFDEEFALSQTQADTVWWFPWYDHSDGRRDYIMIANPNTTTAIIDIYIAGVKKSSAVSIAAGGEWHVRYENLIGGPVKIVSTNGRKIIATKRTLWNEPALVAGQEPDVTQFTAPFSLDVGIGESATTWWSPWYDGGGKKDWVMVVNPGPNYAQVELRIGGEKSDDSPYVIPAGKVWTPRYLDIVGGPLQVISLNNQPILVSQRVLWPDDRSFNELRGIPQSAASTGWYAPWYDATGDKKDVVHVVNPGSSNATINVYIGGIRRTTNAVVPAQGEWHISYPDVKAGPLAVVSTNGQNIMVTQRVLWRVDGSSSFDETVSVPREQLDTKWWFPWYDNTSDHKNWILVGNPSGTSANIDVYVGGNKQNSTPVIIPSGGVWTVRYDNLIGGPVQVVSTNGVKIMASQRVLWDGKAVFNEVMGIPQQLVDLPDAPELLSIGTVGIADAAGNPKQEVGQGDFLQFGTGATNHIGIWEQTTWNWIVKNSSGQTVQEMSNQDNAMFMATGNMGYAVGVTVPTDLAPGIYSVQSQVAGASGSVSDVAQTTFRVLEPPPTYELYLPLIIR